MKRDENKPFLIGILIGIIVIGGIAIFPIIIELNKPKPIIPKPTYSNADITTIQYYNDLNSPATYSNPMFVSYGWSHLCDYKLHSYRGIIAVP